MSGLGPAGSPSHVGLSTFKSGNCRLLVVLVCGLLLGLGMALLLAHPAVREAQHPSTHPYRRDSEAQTGPAALQQLAQLTQELRDSVSQLKQQQQHLGQQLGQQQQQQQAAGTGPSSEQIAQLSKELREGVSQLKQGLQAQLQQLAKRCDAQRHNASPSPAPAAPAVVPDLSAFSDPVLPDIAKKVLELDKQQAGKRVISFSLFGAEPRYVQGSIENALLARRDWPGWTLRVYYGEGVPEDVLGILRAFSAELIRIDTKQERASSTLWRYYPAADPTVTRFVARDIDARISHRDKAAVDEWVASGLYFHTMHDAPQHTDPILGGLWGAVGGFLNPKFLQPLINNTGAEWGIDQNWLREHLWPHVQNYTLDHNAYNCGVFKAADNMGFPIKREGLHDMVGNVHYPPDFIGYTHSGDCPERCRRQPDWTVC